MCLLVVTLHFVAVRIQPLPGTRAATGVWYENSTQVPFASSTSVLVVVTCLRRMVVRVVNFWNCRRWVGHPSSAPGGSNRHPVGLAVALTLLCHDVVGGCHAGAPTLDLEVAVLQGGSVCHGASDLTVPHLRHGVRVAIGGEDGLQGSGSGAGHDRLRCALEL